MLEKMRTFSIYALKFQNFNIFIALSKIVYSVNTINSPEKAVNLLSNENIYEKLNIYKIQHMTGANL